MFIFVFFPRIAICKLKFKILEPIFVFVLWTQMHCYFKLVIWLNGQNTRITIWVNIWVHQIKFALQCYKKSILKVYAVIIIRFSYIFIFNVFRIQQVFNFCFFVNMQIDFVFVLPKLFLISHSCKKILKWGCHVLEILSIWAWFVNCFVTSSKVIFPIAKYWLTISHCQYKWQVFWIFSSKLFYPFTGNLWTKRV